MTDNSLAGYDLRLNITIAAAPQRVFDAWLDADTLTRWFAPSADMTCEVLQLEPREGGRYYFRMQDADGEDYNLHGEYLRIVRPSELVMSFYWQSMPEDVMLATVKLTAIDGHTALELHHQKLPSETSRDMHLQGWGGSLARLQQYFE